MNRILGTVVAIAGVLAFSTLASAAPFSFNVTGTGTAVTVSSFATVPCGGSSSGPNCFTNPFSAGSSIDLDITAGVATITSGTLNIDTTTVLFGGGAVVTTDVVGSLSGGLGSLVGTDILWTTPAAYTIAGTLTCTGAACGGLGLTSGVPVDISYLGVLGNTSGVNPIALGTWDLDAGLANILGSSRAVSSISNVAPNLPAGWLVFGPSEVPEPGSAALVLLGLGALALRARKA